MTRNEILAENILLEKSQLEEAENLNHIRQLEEERTELQKELGTNIFINISLNKIFLILMMYTTTKISLSN